MFRVMLAVLLLGGGVQGARILALAGLASPSHVFFMRTLTRALVDRGHQVTEVSALPSDGATPNLTSIQLEGTLEAVSGMLKPSFIGRMGVLVWYLGTRRLVSQQCEQALGSAGARRLLNYPPGTRFDVVITEACLGECLFGFVARFGAPPVVGVSSLGTAPWLASALGGGLHPAHAPHQLLGYSSTMTFQERLVNFVVSAFWHVAYAFSLVPLQEAVARRHLQDDLPAFADIQGNVSVYLTNIVHGLDFALPLSPNVIPVGGMHLTKRKATPLPPKVQKFLDGAAEGAILFSLGTWIQGAELEGKLPMLVEAFSELPQRVLWKLDQEDLPLPASSRNIMVSKWLPQIDVLAHPNVRLFVSHCGRMGVLEAAYHGVPVVGIPLFADQFSVARIVQERGFGLVLHYPTLTKRELLAAIREVLTNHSYRESARRLGVVMRDQPDDPLERAVRWTEFVIRHRGAPHLRPAAAHLYWHQFLLLDVLAALAAGALLAYMACSRLCKLLLRSVKIKAD